MEYLLLLATLIIVIGLLAFCLSGPKNRPSGA